MRKLFLWSLLAITGCSPAYAKATVKKAPKRDAAAECKDIREAIFEGWVSGNGLLLKDTTGKIWTLWIDKTGHLQIAPL